MIFKFEKPVYGSYFMIWDKWLKIAKRKHLKIVAISEFGTATYDSYKDWLKDAERGEHEHNIPGVPMIFYGRSILPDIKTRKVRKKVEEKERKERAKMIEQTREDYNRSLEVKLAAMKAALHK